MRKREMTFNIWAWSGNDQILTSDINTSQKYNKFREIYISYSEKDIKPSIS